MAIEEVPGGHPERLSHAKDVVRGQHDVDVRTALIEAGAVGTTSKSEFAVEIEARKVV